MADPSVKDAADAVKEYAEVTLDYFKNLISGTADAKNAFGEFASNAVGSLEKISNAATGAGIEAIINKITDGFKDFGSKIKGSVTHLDTFSASTAGTVMLLASAAAGINFMGAAFTAMGAEAANASFQVSNIEVLMAKFGKNLPPGIESIVKPMKNLVEAGEGARNLENAYLSAAAAGGNLVSVMDKAGKPSSQGGIFGNMDEVMQRMYTHVRSVGDATGRSSGEVAKYYQELLKLPGAIEETINVSQAATSATDSNSTAVQGSQDSYDRLIATIKVADGTHQSFNEVQKTMNTLFMELGASGQKSLEMFSLMNDTAQALKMPFETMRGFTVAAAQNFKYLGDNTQGAIEIMNKFSPSLKEFGLGPTAISETVGNIIQNISKLDMAKKAFLSGQTGGSGGMKGAFQIDLMLKEGKLGEVQKKVEESLRKQMGGKIVSLEEAAKSDSAANQMAKQIQILTSGPLKIANDEQQAEAIIQAMAKGEKAPEMKTPQEALQKTIETGNNIETRQMTELVSINNTLEYIGNQQATAAYQLTRLVIGTDKNDLNKESENRIIQNMKEARINATAANPVTSQGPTTGVSTLDVGKTLDNIKTLVKGFMNKDNTPEQKKKMEEELKKTFNRQAASPTENVTAAVTGATQQEAATNNVANNARAENTTSNIKIEALCYSCGKTFQDKLETNSKNITKLNSDRAAGTSGSV